MKITQKQRIEMIISYASKVVQYPKGSDGYTPVDMFNLKNSLEKYEENK